MSAARPFRILGIQQIAIGGEDKQRLRRLWVDMLGLEVTGNFVSKFVNSMASEISMRSLHLLSRLNHSLKVTERSLKRRKKQKLLQRLLVASKFSSRKKRSSPNLNLLPFQRIGKLLVNALRLFLKSGRAHLV